MERHLRALIVEDSPSDVDLIREMLIDRSELSLSLEHACRLSQGLKTLRRDHVDLVLLDLWLPDSQGFETFATTYARAPQLPIIVLTGLDDKDLALRAVREGAQDYLVKGKVTGELLSRSIRYAVERKRAQEALRESEERYRQLVENANDIIYTQDLKGNIMSANAAATRVYGYTDEDVPELTLERLVDPEHMLAARRMIEDQLEGRDDTGPYELLTHAKNGDPVWVEVNPRLVERHGSAPEIQGIARDITERKEMEERLRRQERLAALGQLAAGVAHDFRNLLTTIILYAQLSKRQGEVHEAVNANLDVIIEESHKATDLVQQILDFSSNAMIERRPLDLKAFAKESLQVLRRTIPEDIRLTLQTDPEPHCVEADTGRLQQALTNLALNARDAMPGGGELRFQLSRTSVDTDQAPGRSHDLRPGMASLPPGDWVSIAVSDTGVGMSEEVQEHLFEPFFTTKEVGEGTGLGLAQVYGIVRQHDGYVDVETELGEGSTFWIHLPACDEAPVADQAEAGDAPRGLGETILLVEDEPRLREAGKQVVESMGYEVMAAANGCEALRLCGLAEEGKRADQARDRGEADTSGERAAPVDLLITDLVMPDMGGRALARELERSAPHIQRIAMTGYALDDEDRQALQEAGFAAVVHKPFERAELARAIRKALDS